MFEAVANRGDLLRVRFHRGHEGGVRFHEIPAQPIETSQRKVILRQFGMQAIRLGFSTLEPNRAQRDAVRWRAKGQVGVEEHRHLIEQ